VAIKVTVRIGGDVGSTTWNATSQVRVFGDDSEPLLTASHRYDNGAASQFEFEVDDDVGEIPRVDLTKNLASHNVVTVSEDASGTEYWTARGRIADKGWGRGDKPWGDSRAASVRVDDGNIDLKGLNLTAHWDRPSETGRTRTLAALAAFCNGSPRLTTVIATHLVAAGGEVTMPAKKYLAGAPLGEILEDCAAVEGKIGGVVLHHSGGSHLCYLYIDEDDHTTYLSTYRITDTSPNLTTQYPPQWEQGDATVEMGGENPISTLISRHGSGDDSFVVSTDATIITAYDYWAETFNDSTSVNATQAQRRADSTRRYRGREHVTHQVTIQVRADEVHLVEAGMSIEIRAAAAMAGQYLGTVQTRRIAQCKKEPIAPNVGAVDGFYNLHLMLDRPQKVLPERVGLPVGPKPAGGGSAELVECGRGTAGHGDHTIVIPSGLTNSMLVCMLNKSNLDTPFSATWTVGGTPQVMTSVPGTGIIHSIANPLGWRSAMQAFYLLNPTAGSGALSSNTGWKGFWLFKNVDSSDPFGSIVTAEGIDASGELTIAESSGAFYINGFGINEPLVNATPVVVAGQTQCYAANDSSIEHAGGHGDSTPGWTFGGARLWLGIGIAVQGSGAATQPVGATGTGTVGTNDGTFVGPSHVHEHGDIVVGGPYHMAEDVTAADAGGYYTGTNVEAQLQELGPINVGGGGFVRTTLGGKEVINTVAASGSTETLDLVTGNVHDVTLTANCTITLTGATAGVACAITVLLRQDGTGSRLVTWPGSVTWIGGAAPTLQTAAAAFDVIVLFTLDGGTNWIGSAGAAVVSDHGGLTGLADDDHSAYTTVVGGGGETRQVHGNTGATETVDLANGNAHDLTLDAATVTLTLTAPVSGVQNSVMLYLRQDATGSRLVSWPSSVKWPSGVAPTLATTGLDVNVVKLVTLDGGTNWFGHHYGAYTPAAAAGGGTFPVLALSTNL
jgi:hypothetical protein